MEPLDAACGKGTVWFSWEPEEEVTSGGRTRIRVLLEELWEEEEEEEEEGVPY